MVRWWMMLVGLIVALGTFAFAIHLWLSPSTHVAVEVPEFVDSGGALPEADQFAQLARTDPVAMLAKCLERYSREVTGFRATVEKRERVAGMPHDTEVVTVAVRGETADPAAPSTKPRVHVRMDWVKGARKAYGSTLRSTLFVDGEHDGKIVTWRPEALWRDKWVGLKDDPVRESSRYSIRDAGLYHGMLRTHTVWNQRAATGELSIEYLGTMPVEQAGGRLCHVVRRSCPKPEVDTFSLDEAAPTDPRVIERDGFTEVTLMIDTDRWLQVGTVLKRGDVLIGEYFYRDLELNPTFAPDTFTIDGLKRVK